MRVVDGAGFREAAGQQIANFAASPPSRWSAGSRRAARRRLRPEDQLWFAAAVLVVFMLDGHAELPDGRRPTLVRLGIPLPRCSRVFRHRAAVRVRDRPADGRRGLHLRTPGLGSVGLAAVVLFVFLYILRTSIQAEERGDELSSARATASLQMGLLSTVLQTLSMRDAMTARHSAAVARYSREVAGMLGLDEREQDLIHTAALLHDIGKFILPDSCCSRTASSPTRNGS